MLHYRGLTSEQSRNQSLSSAEDCSLSPSLPHALRLRASPGEAAKAFIPTRNFVKINRF